MAQSNSAGQADVVTEAQQQLLVLCSHFYATLGSLQRDAPALSVKGEDLLAPLNAAQSPISQQTKVMAQQVTEASERLQELVLHLPDTLETEEQRIKHVQDLQQQHMQAGHHLAAALQEAQNSLTKVQDCFAEVTDKQLRCHSL